MVAEALFVLIEHLASALGGFGNLDVAFEGLSAASLSHFTCCNRWDKELSGCDRLFCGLDLVLDLTCESRGSLEVLNLLEHVLSVVCWHLHSLVEIVKS